MWLDLIRAHPRLKLDEDEVVVFLSQSEDNLRLVYGCMELDDGALVLRSRELRMMKGTWSIFQLKEYARRAGLKINDWTVLDRVMKKAKDKLTAALKAA